MVLFGRTVALGLALAGLCGCLKTPPKVQPVTAMTMPSPPAHVLIPVVLMEPAEPAPVEPEPPAAASAPNRPRPGGPATRPAERPPSTAAAEPPAPPPVLQTTADGRQADAIRSKVLDAEQKLNALNLRELNVSARAQVEQARGFIRRANEALKIKNYLYAEQLARKAAAVANQLGR
jgi:hypothetical protein